MFFYNSLQLVVCQLVFDVSAPLGSQLVSTVSGSLHLRSLTWCRIISTWCSRDRTHYHRHMVAEQVPPRTVWIKCNGDKRVHAYVQSEIANMRTEMNEATASRLQMCLPCTWQVARLCAWHAVPHFRRSNDTKLRPEDFRKGALCCNRFRWQTPLARWLQWLSWRMPAVRQCSRGLMAMFSTLILGDDWTSRENTGCIVAATFWVNASCVLPLLTFTNVKNPGIFVSWEERKKKDKLKKEKKDTKRRQTEKRKKDKEQKQRKKRKNDKKKVLFEKKKRFKSSKV